MKTVFFRYLGIVVLSLAVHLTWGQLTPACSPTYPSGSISWNISSVSIGSAFTHSPGYSVHDYTSRSFTVDAGSPLNLTIVSRGWCGVGVAADFNNDGDFEDMYEIFPQPAYIAADPATYNFTINIPSTILSGSYRFRLFNIGANAGSGNPAGSPCGRYAYGSWVDYTMIVNNNSSCLPPAGIAVADVQSYTADLSWMSSATPHDGYIWKIVKKGDDPDATTGVLSDYTTDTFAKAMSLTPAEQYELYVKTVCGGGDTSIWNFSVEFETLCDGKPSAGTISSDFDSLCVNTPFSLELSGASSGSSITYRWQVSPASLNDWSNINNSDAPLVNLSFGASSDYRVIVTCEGSKLSDTTDIISIKEITPNKCHCIPTYTNNCSSNDIINDFALKGENSTAIDDINSGCGVGNFENRTAQSVDLYIGEVYTASISTRNSGNNARVWIDFNDDGVFQDSETVGTVSSISSTSSSSFDITIPDTVSVGTFKMRVRLVRNTAATSINPCSNYSYGEAHDYMVNIVMPTGCLAPRNLSVTNNVTGGATLAWQGPLFGDPAQDYDFEVRESGAPGSGSAGMVLNGFNINATFAALFGLTNGNAYTAYVRTNCAGSGQSAWSKGITFKLPTYVPVVISGFNADVIANGVGTAASSTTNDVDGVNYVLVAQDFRASTTGPAPSAFLPGHGNVQNGDDKWFRLADYNEDNSLRLTGSSRTGAIRFMAPRQAVSVHVLGISGSGVSTVSAEVWFSDGSSEVFNNLVYPDWYANSGTRVMSGVGRVNKNNNNIESPGPNLYENSLNISTANQSKGIDSIVFTNASSSAGVMNVLAVSIIPNYAQDCALPGALLINNITSEGADLSWGGNGTSSDYQVSFGKKGISASNGTVIDVLGGTDHQFSKLSSSTEYDVFVRAICPGNTYSDWVGPLRFKTLLAQCSDTPEAGEITATDTSVCANSPFELKVTGTTVALGITTEWWSSPSKTDNWTPMGASGNTININTQEIATDYRFIVSCANSNLSDTVAISIAQNPVALCYCIPQYMIGCRATYMINDFILTGESGTSINDVGTGCSTDAYDDRTGQSVDLHIGESYNGLISSGTSGNNARIWIDFNNNGTFENEETVALISGIGTSQSAFTLNIPDTVSEGQYRMRVRLVYSTAAASINPCSSYSYGETHDYMADIIMPSGCLPPKNLSVGKMMRRAATLTWAPHKFSDPVLGYDFEIRESGLPGSGPTGLAQSGLNLGDTFVDLSNLDPGLTYVAYVKAHCAGSTESDWTPGLEFMLPTYVPVEISGYNADVIANGTGLASTSTNNDVDRANYVYIAEDYRTPSGVAAGKALPIDGHIRNAEKWFRLKYDENNTLRLDGASKRGTLQFKVPRKAISVHILGASGSGNSTADAQVWFTDGTFETFNALTLPDWHDNATNIVVAKLDRLHRLNNTLYAAGPNLYETTLQIPLAAQSRQIDSIVFTTGSSSAGVRNIMAVSIIPNDTVDCDSPGGLAVTNITDSEADIAWKGTATDYEISFGFKGITAGNGTVIGVPGAVNYSLDTLSPSTAYQVYVRSICFGGDYSDWVGPVDFTTLPKFCKGTPDAGVITATDPSVCSNQSFDLTVSGATIDSGVQFEWYSSPAGLGTWSLISSQSHTLTINSQANPTDYRFIALCEKSGLSDTAFITIDQADGDCYCSPIYTYGCADHNIRDVVLEGDFASGINNLNTPCPANGYDNFTDRYTILTAGSVYGGNVTTLGSASENVRIWIDYNSNGKFEDREAIAVLANMDKSSPGDFSFTVPDSVSAGDYRMRIRLVYDVAAPTIDPCAEYEYGEAHDYTVKIVESCKNALVDLGGDLVICEGEAATLDAGAGGLKYLWDGRAAGQTRSVNAGGSYEVTVVYDLHKCFSSDTVNVSLTPLPLVDLGNDQVICDGETVVLDAGNAGLKYTWNDKSTDQTLKVARSGTYSVAVADGKCSSSDTVEVVVTPLPVVNLGSDVSLCEGESVTLDAGNKGLKYTWNDKSTSQTLKVSSSGTYSVTVADGKCLSGDTVEVVVTPLPVVDLGNDVTLCDGESVILNAGNPGLKYTWNDRSASQTLKVTAGGTYSVTVADGKCSSADTIEVTVIPIPVVNLGDDITMCEGETVVLDAGNPGLKHSWNDGSTNQTLKVTTGGFYTVTVADGKCSAADTVEVVVVPMLIVDLGNDTTICEGDILVLNAGHPNQQYRWNDHSGNQWLEVLRGGTYFVTVMQGDCSGSDTIEVKLMLLPDGKSIIVEDNGDGTFKFRVENPEGIYAYFWTFEDGSTYDSPEVVHAFGKEGNHKVEVIMSNECGEDTLYTSWNVVKVPALPGEDRTLKLYPNPAKDKIMIVSTGDLDMKDIKVLNMLGQEVYKRLLQDERRYEMDVSGLASGVYTIYIQTDKGFEVRKFEVLK